MKQITLAGTVGRDSELKHTQKGEMLTFSVAVDDGYGQDKKTMWFDVVVFGKRGASLEPHIKKGTKVTVCGEFGAREHNDKTYFTCKASEIDIQGGGQQRTEQGQPRQQPSRQPSFQEEMENDDIPF